MPANLLFLSCSRACHRVENTYTSIIRKHDLRHLNSKKIRNKFDKILKENELLSLVMTSVFTVSIKTETLCSPVVSVMSVSKKGPMDNSEGQTQNTVLLSPQTRRVYYASAVACHFVNLFFSGQKKLCKKGVIVVIT